MYQIGGSFNLAKVDYHKGHREITRQGQSSTMSLFMCSVDGRVRLVREMSQRGRICIRVVCFVCRNEVVERIGDEREDVRVTLRGVVVCLTLMTFDGDFGRMGRSVRVI